MASASQSGSTRTVGTTRGGGGGGTSLAVRENVSGGVDIKWPSPSLDPAHGGDSEEERALRTAGRSAYDRGDLEAAYSAYEQLGSLKDGTEFEPLFMLALLGWLTQVDDKPHVLKAFADASRVDPAHPAPYLLSLSVHAAGKEDPESVPFLVEKALGAAIRHRFSPLAAVKRSLWAYVALNRIQDAEALIRLAKSHFPAEAGKYDVSLMQLRAQANSLPPPGGRPRRKKKIRRKVRAKVTRKPGGDGGDDAASVSTYATEYVTEYGTEYESVAPSHLGPGEAAGVLQSRAISPENYPQDVCAILATAILKLDGGNASSAVDMLETLAEDHPRSVDVYYLLGTAYARDNEPRLAQERLQYAHAIAHGKDVRVVDELLSLLMGAPSESSSAASMSEEVLTLLDALVSASKAGSGGRMGTVTRVFLDAEPYLCAPAASPRQVLALLDRAGEVDPTGVHELGALHDRVVDAHISHAFAEADAASASGNLPREERVLMRALALDAKDATLLMRLADVRLRRDNPSGAYDAATRALELAPDAPETVLLFVNVAQAIASASLKTLVGESDGGAQESVGYAKAAVAAVEALVDAKRRFGGSGYSYLGLVRAGEWAFIQARNGALPASLALDAPRSEADDWERVLENIRMGIKLDDGRVAFLAGDLGGALAAYKDAQSSSDKTHMPCTLWLAVLSQATGDTTSADHHYAALLELAGSGGVSYEGLLASAGDSLPPPAYLTLTRSLRKLHDRHHLQHVMSTPSSFPSSAQGVALAAARAEAARSRPTAVMDRGATNVLLA